MSSKIDHYFRVNPYQHTRMDIDISSQKHRIAIKMKNKIRIQPFTSSS